MNSIDYIIIHYLEGTLSDVEQQYLKVWLAESEEHIIYLNEFERRWLQSGMMDRERYARGWNQMELRLGKVSRIRYLYRFRYMIAIAASLSLFVGSSLLFFQDVLLLHEAVKTEIVPGNNKALLYVEGEKEKIIVLDQFEKDTLINGIVLSSTGTTLTYENKSCDTNLMKWNRLETPRGGEYTIVLSDGTKIWMNVDSKLKYPTCFNGAERKVYLVGEAYFEVRKDFSHPFIVDANDVEIEVTGTSFNVRNYDRESVVTTLVDGGVVVKSQHTQVELKPGEQALYNDNRLVAYPVDVDEFVGWRDGYFVFRDRSLDRIMQELSRWYDFSYTYDEDLLKDLILTAKLQKFDEVENLFEILSNAGNLDFIQNDHRNITIKLKR